MFWSVKGARNVLDLRTFLLSNRFDDLWLARDQKAAYLPELWRRAPEEVRQ